LKVFVFSFILEYVGTAIKYCHWGDTLLGWRYSYCL